ncbi:MAG: Hpt domain-containing protein [Planctomycetaceae bacterium]|nr:Hpt domain-containing protein [Planctomycetaceae bacterium]
MSEFELKGRTVSAMPTGSTNEIFCVDELLGRCMGNIDFAARVLARFQDRFEVDLQELDQAIAAQDAEATARVAHRIKGAAANVAAVRLHEWSSAIEQLGRASRLSDAPAGINQLRQEWSRFVDYASALGLHSANAR